MLVSQSKHYIQLYTINILIEEDICSLFFCLACITDGLSTIFHAIIGQKDIYKVLNCGSEMVIFRKREAKV